MTPKKTILEINEILIQRGFYLIDYYVGENNKTRVIIYDNSGYMYDVCLATFNRDGIGVSIAEKRNPYSLKNISRYLEINNKSFYLSDRNIEYSGKNTVLDAICLNCNDNFNITWDRINAGSNCTHCSNTDVGRYNNVKHISPELIEEWDYEKNSKIPEETMGASHEKVWWVCSTCGYKWKTEVRERCLYHKGCSVCSGSIVSDKNRLSILFPKLSKELHSDNIFSAYDVSYGSSKSAIWKCSKCDFVWSATISDRTSGGNGCPNCRKSRGEDRVQDFLNDNCISYIREYKYDDCLYKRKLPFDFYLCDYDVLIEYDGTTHYFDKYNDPKEFELVQIRDSIKTKYCQDNNIPLLRIPYWEFDNIETIITEFLQNLETSY